MTRRRYRQSVYLLLPLLLPSLCQTTEHSRRQQSDRVHVSHGRAPKDCPSQYLEAWPPGNKLPVCAWKDFNSQAYLAGKWVRLPESCRPRTMEQLEDRTYKYRQECANPEYACGIGTDGCYDRLLRIAQWVWQPTECQLMPFNASLLSESLSGKHVHFVGDSTMRQQFWSFGSLMEKGGAVTADTKQMLSFTTRHNATFSVDGLEFLTGDRSDPADLTFDSTTRSTWLYEAGKADYLIFNTGFHHHRRDMQFHHYASMVSTVMDTLKSKFKGLRAFFSTTRIAHEWCGLNAVPLDYYEGSNGTYHWIAPFQNEYRWTEAAQRLNMDNFHVLNNSVDYLRGESHVSWQKKLDGTVFDDCLHQCYPGVPDYFNWIAMHALVQAAEEDQSKPQGGPPSTDAFSLDALDLNFRKRLK